MAGDSDDIILMILLNFFLFPVPSLTSSDSSLCFVLVQMAYTEMFFVDKFWPEISHRDLRLVLQQFDDRQRRFGV